MVSDSVDSRDGVHIVRTYLNVALYVHCLSCYIVPSNNFNPLNAELNPICHLLALLGAHLIFHVSRIRVKHLPMNEPS